MSDDVEDYCVTLRYYVDSRSVILHEAEYVLMAQNEVEAHDYAIMGLSVAIPAVLIRSVVVERFTHDPDD